MVFNSDNDGVDQGSELSSNRTGGLLDTPSAMTFDQRYVLNTAATLDSNQRTTFTLREFQKNKNQEVNISDKSVSLTVYFTDGSARTYTFNPV